MPEGRAEAMPGRRRDAAATREAILAAAAHRFAAHGYEHAGAREIAADAGVTAAMVNRYFGSKERLFAEVVERAFDLGPLLHRGRATLADDLARLMVFGREDGKDDRQTPLFLLLRSATEPRAAELLRQNLDRTSLRLLAELIGGGDAPLKAAMVVAQLTGFAIVYRALRPEAVAAATPESLVALLSRCLASCLDPAPAPPRSQVNGS